MKKVKLVFLFVALVSCYNSIYAGGILTNTNQNIAFLRNPARDAAIGIDGVYTNPAGVVFLDNGVHVSFNWQYAHQTRTITTTNPDFKLGVDNGNQDVKKFKGVANAPVIPSLQIAYNKDRWSFQGAIAVTGGGGKCEFAEGIGSFESAIGTIANQLQPLGAAGYDADAYMRGKQYYFGITLGSAYKITDNLSVYGGLRLLYGTASYKAKVENIQVKTDKGMVPFGGFVDNIVTNYGQLQQLYATYGDNTPEPYLTQYKALSAKMPQIESLEVYREGISMMSDQSGIGIAPIIGIDYKTGNWNFAAKYEFKTRMRMKNSSTVKEPHLVSALNKYLDGTSVPEDQPALFTVGAQWSVLPTVRVNAGYHLFFDKSAHWYNHEEDKLDGNTWEVNGGAEWDITDKLQVSGGIQKTNYGLSDAYMNDMSFVVSSYTFGLGFGYQISKKVKVNVAYFQTNYDTYKQDVTPTALNNTTHNDFTRTNNVFGVGVDLKL